MGELHESQVTDRVTIGIVDRLEPVEVKHEDRGARGVGGIRQDLAQPFDEKSSVGKPCQRVVSRQPARILFGALSRRHLLRQVPHSTEAEDYQANADDKDDEDEIVNFPVGMIHPELKQLRRKVIPVSEEVDDQHGASNRQAVPYLTVLPIDTVPQVLQGARNT